MRALLALLFVAWTASPAHAGQTGSLESRVAEAVAAEVRARMGADAKVSVGRVEVSVRRGLSGSVKDNDAKFPPEWGLSRAANRETAMAPDKLDKPKKPKKKKKKKA